MNQAGLTQRREGLTNGNASLVAHFMPRPIHDGVGYENICEIADAFAGYEGQMTADQEDYYDLLCTLIERYDEGRIKWPKVTGLAMLKHLVGNHEMTGAGLSRLLGSSGKLGAMILRGERAITAEHARTLGRHFGLNPGVFIE